MSEVQYHIGETLDEALGDERERSFDPREFGYDFDSIVSLVDLVRDDDEDSDTGYIYTLSVSCSEPLEFHRRQYPELFEPFEDEDDEPEMTAEGFEALRQVFEDRYSGIDILETSDGYLKFEVYAQEQHGDFPIDALDEGTIWPVIAQITNELDPGTFGSEYVWTEIARVARANRAE